MSLPSDRGLHQIANELGSLQRFQENCVQLSKELDDWIQRTDDAVTLRDEYVIHREDTMSIHANSGFENRLERSLWQTYGPQGNVARFLNPECPQIVSYQVALYNARQQLGWGEIDLLGFSSSGLPTVIELKQEQGDNPLRMVIEGIAYCIAVRKAWNQGSLREAWEQETKTENPREISKLSLIGMAPAGYWSRVIGTSEVRTAGQVFPEHWAAFRRLLKSLADHGFDVRFASFEIDNAHDTLPHVSNARFTDIPS